jgi:hypothetical protein
MNLLTCGDTTNFHSSSSTSALLLDTTRSGTMVTVVRRSSNKPVYRHLKILHQGAGLVTLDAVAGTCIIAKSFVRRMVIDIICIDYKEGLFPRSIFRRAFLTTICTHLQKVGLWHFEVIFPWVKWHCCGTTIIGNLVRATVDGRCFVAARGLIRAIGRMVDIIKSRHCDFLLSRSLNSYGGYTKGHLFLEWLLCYILIIWIVRGNGNRLL